MLDRLDAAAEPSLEDTSPGSRCARQRFACMSQAALDLPELTADEAAHSARLAERVREVIGAAGGWISFERFMTLALYEPGPRLLQRRCPQIRARGRFHHGAGSRAGLQPLPCACSAQKCCGN